MKQSTSSEGKECRPRSGALSLSKCGLCRRLSSCLRRIETIEIASSGDADKNYNVYLAFALFFAVLWAAIYSYFAAQGKSFLFSDGLNQHLMAIAYYGKYLRLCIAAFFTRGRIEPLMWDWTIGYGADVITTLHYYCIGDILAWTAVFVPVRYTLVLYHVLVFLRMLLCGISCLLFCRYHKAGKTESLCAALVYAFCGFNLYCAVRHPYFTSPLIFLPLLCIGADRIITEKKPFMFAIVVFISCASNFYFFYMVSILVFIYAVVRVSLLRESEISPSPRGSVAIHDPSPRGLGTPSLRRPLGLKQSWYTKDVFCGTRLLRRLRLLAMTERAAQEGRNRNDGKGSSGGQNRNDGKTTQKGKIGGAGNSDTHSLISIVLMAVCAYAVGVMLAAPVFFPQIAGFLSSSRVVAEDTSFTLFYRLNYYVKLMFAFASPVSFDSYTLLGFAAPALPLFLCVLFGRDRIAKHLRVFAAILVVFLIFPFFGHVFNGFNYVSNRWTFCLALPVSYAVAIGMPIMSKADIKQLKWPLAVCAFLCLAVFAASAASHYMRRDFLAAYIVLAAFLAVALWLASGPRAGDAVSRGSPLGHIKPFQGRKSRAFNTLILASICLSIIINGTLRYNRHFYGYIDAFKDMREACSAMDFISKGSSISSKNKVNKIERIDTSSYPAINAPAVMGEMGTTYYWAQSNDNLFRFFDKFSLGTLMAVKTLEERAALEAFLSVKKLPNGTAIATFAPAKVGGAERPTLPFGFTYKDAITQSDALRLTPLERQDALLRYIVIDDDAAKGLDTVTVVPSGNIKQLRLSAEESPRRPHETEQDDGIKWIDENTFSVTKSNAVMHLKCRTVPGTETYLVMEDLRRTKGSRPNDNVDLLIKCGEIERERSITPAAKSWGHDVMTQLGRGEKGVDSVSIQFDTKGEYHIGSMRLYAVDTASIAKDIEERSENALRDVAIGTNTLDANIEITGGKKVLCMTMPYSAGWKAKVDGLDVPLLRVQYGFTGMILDEGEHTINMRYKTPLFLYGIAAALAGWVLLIAYLIHHRGSK